MATPITKKLPILSNTAIASYPSGEIQDGIATTAFYLTRLSVNGTPSYGLTTNTTSYANSPAIIGAGGSNTTTRFTSPAFNLPRTIPAGVCYLNIGVAANQATYITARVYHIDADTTATALSSEIQSDSITTDGQTFNIPITLTEKHFDRGDKLAIDIRMNVGAGASNSEYGCDPANRDGAVINPSTDTNLISSSRLYIPFRIDLQ